MNEKIDTQFKEIKDLLKAQQKPQQKSQQKEILNNDIKQNYLKTMERTQSILDETYELQEMINQLII